MAGTVGGIACDFVHGRANKQREASRAYFVRGFDRPGVVLEGLRGGELTLRCSYYGGITAPNSVYDWIASMQALQGTTVTVVNDLGETIDNVFLQEVAPVGAGVRAADRRSGGYPDSDGLVARVMITGVVLEEA